MNTLRYLLFAATVVISSATLALGGEMQAPGKSEPPSPSPASASTTESTTGRIMVPTSPGEIEITWQDLTTLLLKDILLTIY